MEMNPKLYRINKSIIDLNQLSSVHHQFTDIEFFIVVGSVNIKLQFTTKSEKDKALDKLLKAWGNLIPLDSILDTDDNPIL